MATQTIQARPAASSLSWRDRFRNMPYYLILILWSVFTILIFVWLLESSFKTNREVFRDPWSLPGTPVAAAAANYSKAWATAQMSVYFANSVIVTTVSVLLVVAVSAPAAYVLSRIPFPGNTFLSYYFIAGMGLPFQLILVPLYVLLAQLGLLNTLVGLILTYVGVSVPFTILLLTGFFRTLPSELEDAAAIDGSTDFGIFWRVMLPLAGPGLFTAAIFNFVTIWNEFLLALLIINEDALRTMPLGIYSIRTTMQYTADWAALFAAMVIVIVPSFLIYLLLSERIMAGLTLGASK